MEHRVDETIEVQQDDHQEHIGLPGYFAVFLILFVGTIVTYVVALQDLDGALFPGANTLVALSIAFFKMSCVILFFMHVRWSSKLIWLTAVSGFFWLAIMFAFTMGDYLTRSTGTF
ncbi:MAG: cytochrome C oxidase subunit IV family protein [Pyrinomonadaceae bacterium]|nr:cytochrome C oxidase subunit IV family protein [Pyrinomonadaceae bacterium]